MNKNLMIESGRATNPLSLDQPQTREPESERENYTNPSSVTYNIIVCVSQNLGM